MIGMADDVAACNEATEQLCFAHCWCNCREPGEFVGALRERAELSVQELARRVGVPARTILDWENQTVMARVSSLRKVADTCEIELLDFLIDVIVMDTAGFESMSQ